MKALLLTVLLIPAPAQADTCTRESDGPCLPPDIQETKKPIMEAIRDALTARNEMAAALKSTVRTATAGDAEGELLSWTAAREAEVRMKASANRAVQLTQLDYHLTPHASSDPRAQSRR